MTKNEQYQHLLFLYKEETGETELNMDAVAKWALKRGVEAPKPKTPTELLARKFSEAARLEHKKDLKTGYSYRVYHAVPSYSGNGKQQSLWIDIHSATRNQMSVTLTNRRQQMIGDAQQLTIDQTIWNNMNPSEEQIQMILDFTEDVAERLSIYNDQDEVA